MPATVRFSKDKKYLYILCDMGHLIESHKLDNNFGGSWIESELGSRHPGDRWDRLSNSCKGAGHDE